MSLLSRFVVPSWLPVIAIVSEGGSQYMKIIDWTGGVGVKPERNLYVGSRGYVKESSDAVRINTGGGGGGSYFFTNGLREKASAVYLGRGNEEDVGGFLTQGTKLIFSPLVVGGGETGAIIEPAITRFQIETDSSSNSEKGYVGIIRSGGILTSFLERKEDFLKIQGVYLGLSLAGFPVGDQARMIIYDSINQVGLEDAMDYSEFKTPLSYVTKKMLDEASLGSQGPQGATGSQGAQGTAGAQGPQGFQGAQGGVNPSGVQSVQEAGVGGLVNNIIRVTQSEYDGLAVKNPNTFYVIPV